MTGSGSFTRRREQTEKAGAEWKQRRKGSGRPGKPRRAVSITSNHFQWDMLITSTFQESWERRRMVWNMREGMWTNCLLLQFSRYLSCFSPHSGPPDLCCYSPDKASPSTPVPKPSWWPAGWKGLVLTQKHTEQLQPLLGAGSPLPEQ